MRKPIREKRDTKKEDEMLVDYVRIHGEGCGRSLPRATGRCGKSCRLRWINYTRPDLKSESFGEDEDDLIIKLHALLGNRMVRSIALSLCLFRFRRLVHMYNLCNFMVYPWIGQFLFGSVRCRWSLIAGRLPGRTDNEVENYWNSHLKKKLLSMGIDPNNHGINHTLRCRSENQISDVSNSIDSSSCATSEVSKALNDHGQERTGNIDRAHDDE